ncbi:MAG: RDD family protein [SAR202 cluster bacterium]|nr:RDD family protein [SAR202 cluster bacterium]|tara:strand:- start:138 stop:770 length:633 start_codon:yes stop_codon:yes gene_type:complete
MPSSTKKRRNPRQRSSTARQKKELQPKMNLRSNAIKRRTKRDEPTIYPMVFAGPLRRLYAFTIDLGLIMMVIYSVAPLANGNLFNEKAAPQDIVFFLGYFIVPTIIWGRTPGKWVAGIVVVDSDGRTPGPAAIPREMIGKLVSYLSFGVGILWLILDQKRQGWHDKIAGTYVVDNPYSGGPKFLKDFLKLGEKKAKEIEKSDGATKKIKI